MRVLVVNYEFPPVGGGAGRASWHLSQELSRLGVDTDVLTSQGAHPIQYQLNGVQVYSLPVKRRSIHQSGARGMLEFLFRAAPTLNRLLRRKRYDVIHYFFSVPTGLLSFRAGGHLPFVVSLRGGDVPGYNPGEFQLMHALLSPLNRRIWRRAAAVVALSDHLGKVAQTIEPALKYSVIHNGVDTELFRSTREDGLGDRSRVRILTVGRLVEWKGIQFLIAALAKLRKDTFRLLIAGTGNYEDELRKTAARVGLGDAIRFLGSIPHEDLPHLYNQADIFALPSFGDSFGQVFAEAMACGLPVIAARSGGVQEFLEEGVNGLFAEPQDVESLIGPLKTLIADETRRRKMRVANIKKAVNELSWSSAAKAYLSIYKECLTGGVRPVR